VWIAEDIEQIIAGIEGGSWVDAGIGTMGAGLDGLALVSDPSGVLLQYGIAWLLDHVRPLSEALDWLAGDPGAIAAQAQTWRGVAENLTDQAEDLARAVRWDVSEWEGLAGDAYRDHAERHTKRLLTLGRAADGMALMTEAAGTLIGTVRLMVRDAIATAVSRLVVYATELVASAGLATPLVVEQVATLCASWGARIAVWLRSLLTSLRKLGSAMRELGDRITALARTGSPSPEPPPSPKPPEPPLPPGPPWRSRDDIPGPARGKDLKPPHPRHFLAGSKRGEVKEDTSVVLRGHEDAVRADVAGIAAGRATWLESAGRYEINGRTYAVKPTGTVFPDSGPGLAKLDRNEYAALVEIVGAHGDVSQVAAFRFNPRFLNNPDAIAKAKSIYDGTYHE
jgi:uncharacterized protein YukE